MTQPPALPRASVAPTSSALFGPPPLIEGENAAAYDEFSPRACFGGDESHRHFGRDLAARRRRPRLGNLPVAPPQEQPARGKRAQGVFATSCKRSPGGATRRSWCRVGRHDDPAAIKTIDEGLASTGLTMDAVIAQTLSVKIDDIERIDRMIMTAEARRNAVLREVDRHRANWRRRCVGRAKRSRTRSSRWSNQPKSPIAARRDQRATQAARQSRQCPRQHWSADGRRQGARDT